MDYRDISQEEIDKYNKLDFEEVRNIVKMGINTEFWRLMQSRLALTLKSAELNLLRKNLCNQNDLIDLARWQTIFKCTEEIFNWPDTIIKAKEAPKTAIKKK